MNRILEKIYPDLYIPSVFQLPLENLRKRGINTLVFDIDNTVAPYDVAVPDERLIGFFKQLKSEGFRLCILSNNNKKRVKLFNRPLNTLAVHKAGKPGAKKLLQALRQMGTDPACTAMVGDQIFTDMWCGRKAGLYCIMTAPICNRDQWMTKVKRGLERMVMKRFFRLYPDRVMKHEASR